MVLSPWFLRLNNREPALRGSERRFKEVFTSEHVPRTSVSFCDDRHINGETLFIIDIRILINLIYKYLRSRSIIELL